MARHQGFDRLSPKQGHITIENQQVPLEAVQGRHQLLDRMARAVLGLLQHKFQSGDMTQLLLHPFRLMTNDQQTAVRCQVAGTGEHPFHESGACQWLQNLGEGTFHSSALSCGQHGNGEHAFWDVMPGIYRRSFMRSEA